MLWFFIPTGTKSNGKPTEGVYLFKALSKLAKMACVYQSPERTPVTDSQSSLDRYQSDFRREESKIEPIVGVPGFSQRFHDFLDCVQGMGIPGRQQRGRLAFLSKLTGKASPSVRVWLLKDRPPQEETLVALVRFFLQHIPVELEEKKVLAWLRFGDEATGPLLENAPLRDQDYRDSLKPLAMNLLMESSKSLGAPAKSFDLSATLNDCIDMLIAFEVTTEEEVQTPMKDQIKAFIKKHKHS
ncbi:hypothetical protein HBA55_14145 [Pseudomaricurvus alkylphenolicus]|uniref:hypothetical protein n=1 Tax=Pseudomaricurvus alkylphenolicus TaxID=1306991 RepID=UPI00141FD6B0|nr:hypothetical protein [Pseudomaricurvus alkylphenolicus]NIB40738.1 hypothetical protein [Pseudomaricurvus alkylphenolicus]